MTKIRKTSSSRIQDRRGPTAHGMGPSGSTPRKRPDNVTKGNITNTKGLDYKPVGGKSGGGRWVTTKAGPAGPAGTTVGRSVAEDATVRKVTRKQTRR